MEFVKPTNLIGHPFFKRSSLNIHQILGGKADIDALFFEESSGSSSFKFRQFSF